MSEENWKLEKDLCRCCLSEGSFKNLAEPFQNQGEEEIFSDMLVETLDLNIQPVAGPLCTSTFTICEECVLRLRDACSFKRQVLLSEKRFHDLYSRDVIQLHPSHLDLKKEVPDSDNEDAVKMEADDDDDFRIGYENDDDDKADIQYELINDLDDTPAAKRAKAKKPRANEKPKPRKRAPRPKKVKAEGEAPETQEPEAKRKKDVSVKIALDADISMERDGPLRKYSCNTCGLVCKTIDGIKKHVQWKHVQPLKPPQIFICHICNKQFKQKPYLVRHLKIHATEEGLGRQPKKKTYICDICGNETIGYKKHIVSHMRLHGFYACNDCPKVLSSMTLLKLHKRQKHKVYTCGICGYQGYKEYVILNHQRRSHMKEKNVACTKCDAKFYNISALNQHLIRHNPVKKYECSYCDKKFPRSETKIRHERIHTGEKNKVCEVCDARFVQKASLNYHMKKYHPEAV